MQSTSSIFSYAITEHKRIQTTVKTELIVFNSDCCKMSTLYVGLDRSATPVPSSILNN